MKRKISILMVCLLLIGTLGGCGRLDNADKELNIMLANSPMTIDPQLIGDTNSGFVASFFTAGLFGYNEDREIVPVMAESYEVSEDGQTYTFHLKKGLKWSDGRELTAEDFVYGFQRLVDPDVGSNSVYLALDSCTLKNADDVNKGKKPVSELGVSSPDAHTFVVELEQPCPYFCTLLACPNFSPCNHDFCHSVGESYATGADTILSCGPYTIDRYEPLAMQIHMKKNPNFVEADRIRLSGINLQVVANAQQALMSYESGSLDVTSVSGNLMDLADGSPELKEFTVASSFFLMPNMQTCPALKNQKIRGALSKSIDRDSIVKNVLKTGFTPMSRLNPAGYYKCADGSDFGGEKDRYQKQVGYDPGEALKLWKEGLGELGMTSVKLTVVYPSGMNNLMEALAGQMEKNLPGLELELKALPSKEVIQKQTKKDYEIIFMGWAADYTDPTSFLGLFLSDGPSSNYSNPKYDVIYDQIQSADVARDPETREKMMLQEEDILMDDVAIIPLYSQGNVYLVKQGVTGFLINPTGSGCISIGLDKEVD